MITPGKVLLTPSEVLEAAFWGPEHRALKPDSHKRVAFAQAQKLLRVLWEGCGGHPNERVVVQRGSKRLDCANCCEQIRSIVEGE